MADTFSNMLPLGTKAPAFYLKDTNSNNRLSFNDVKGSKGTLIVFMCNQCPFVLHIIDELVRITNDYRVQGIGIAAISSNAPARYPQDGPEYMAQFAFNNKVDFPYLFDETQNAAKVFDAACTPEFYLFDSEHKLVYHGQLDDSRPANNIPVSGTDLRNAIDGVLYNRNIDENQKPSMGCSIKWK